jgi:transposase InsO family protein
VVRYQRQRPGELVHLDVKKQGRIPDGGGHRVLGAEVGRRNKQAAGYDFVHVAVDDCSRVAYLEVHPDERGVTVAGFAARALAFYASLGVGVERVLTDNGMGYRSDAFREVLASVGVRHKRTRPTGRRPTARPSGSTAPSPWSGPTPGPTPATVPAWTPCRRGCTATTTTVPTVP